MARAVDAAEERTGLQFCVYLGPKREPSELFAEAHPEVLVMVVPEEHHVQVVTSPAARERVPDEAAAAAVELMIDDFKRKRYDRGIVRGVEYLAEVAGPGAAAPHTAELPDVLD